MRYWPSLFIEFLDSLILPITSRGWLWNQWVDISGDAEQAFYAGKDETPFIIYLASVEFVNPPVAVTTDLNCEMTLRFSFEEIEQWQRK